MKAKYNGNNQMLSKEDQNALEVLIPLHFGMRLSNLPLDTSQKRVDLLAIAILSKEFS